MTAFVSYVWRSSSVGARIVRLALTPLSWLFGRMVTRRNAAFDARARRGTLAVPALPALSVGNLTVGGTGKTPVASWFVDRLRAGGASPALVLRGYGDDEWRVHFHLPLHAAPGAPFGDTRDHLLGALDWMKTHPDACQHAEMETYTWEVLPPALRIGIEDQLVREYEWTLAALGERGLA